jgi:hypothetical protein
MTLKQMVRKSYAKKGNSNYAVCFLLGYSPVPTFRKTLSVPSSWASRYKVWLQSNFIPTRLWRWSRQSVPKHWHLTLSLLMSYIYGSPCKGRNFNVVYIWTYVWQRWKPSFSICCTTFQHWINAESYSVPQLCVNTLPATKVTLITDGI